MTRQHLVRAGRLSIFGQGGESLKKMQITAQELFQIFATMNRGGDFGKDSPALQTCFTKIWNPLVSDPQDRPAMYID
jgi:midasin